MSYSIIDIGAPDPFDPKRLALPTSGGLETTSDVPQRRRKRGREFLGPIPWGWLSAAAKLGGKAPLLVTIVLWHLKHLKRRWTVTWQPSVAESLGVTRWTLYRGLPALERAGLVIVERHAGRCPVVTIVHSIERIVPKDAR
jgi:hypothetical protein